MTLQARLFDALSEQHGNGSVEHMLVTGETPPCALRVTMRIGGMRRMFVAAVQEVEGNGTVSIVELDTVDEETPIEAADGIVDAVAQAIAGVMAAAE